MGPEHISIFLLVFMFTEVPVEAVGALDEQDYDLKKKKPWSPELEEPGREC